MNRGIKFSIVVPVYNVENYLAECLESVLSQTYQNYELILVNDGSTDNSGSICDEYSQKHDFIKAFHKHNEGQIATRCFGLKYAVGDYVVFLDSDDELYPNALQVICDYINEYRADCVVFDWLALGIEKSEKKDGVTSVQIYESKRDIFSKVLSNSKYNSMCIKCIRRSAFDEMDYSRYFHIRRGEDLLQTIDALNNCEKVVFVPDVLYKYRMNLSSVTHSIRFDNYRMDYMVRERVLEFLSENMIFNEEDYSKYRTHCISLLVDELALISLFDVSSKKKIQLFKEIKITPSISSKHDRMKMETKKDKLENLQVWELNSKLSKSQKVKE